MTSSPISRLPTEILEDIFFIYVSSTGVCPTLLTEVCHRWAQIVKGAGQLWSLLDLAKPKMVMRQVELARGRPLSVTWLNKSDGPASFLPPIPPTLTKYQWLWDGYSSKIRSLYMVHKSDSLVAMFLKMGDELPTLRELTLINQDIFHFNTSLTLSNRAPCLTALYLSNFKMPASLLSRLLHDCTALREVDLVTVDLEPHDWPGSDTANMRSLRRFDMHRLLAQTNAFLLDRLAFPSPSTVFLTLVIYDFVMDPAHSNIVSKLNRSCTTLEMTKQALRLRSDSPDAFSLVMEVKANFFAITNPLSIDLTKYDVSAIHTLDLTDKFTNYPDMVNMDAAFQALTSLRTVRLLALNAVTLILPALTEALENKPECCPCLEDLWLIGLDLDAAEVLDVIIKHLEVYTNGRQALQTLHLNDCSISRENYERLCSTAGETEVVRMLS